MRSTLHQADAAGAREGTASWNQAQPVVRVDSGKRSFAVARAEHTLRSRRGHLSRRLWRTRLAHSLRISTLLAGDFGASAVAVSMLGMVGAGTAFLDGTPMVPLVALFLIGGQAVHGTYGPGIARRHRRRIVRGVIMGTAALLGIGVLYPVFTQPWWAYPVIGAVGAASFALWRLVFDIGIRAARKRGVGLRRVLIVADDTDAKRIRDHFARAEVGSILLTGHVTPEEIEAAALGGLDRIGTHIERYDVQTVILSARLPADRFRDVVRECLCHGAAVNVVPGSLTALCCRPSGRRILGWPELELEPPVLLLAQMIIKRVVDVMGALVGLILLAPVFALVALAIRLESPGPIFFRQDRPGLGGKSFPLIKFRTMRVDAEEVLEKDPELQAKFLSNDCKIPEGEDPRITRVGRFLRTTSLDELPQLINVLRGEMSLVGPRPIVGPELQHYGTEASTFLAVRPGMTGHWQISGRSEVGYPERAELDLGYIKRWSLLLDLRILLATIPHVLTRRGAH